MTSVVVMSGAPVEEIAPALALLPVDVHLIDPDVAGVASLDTGVVVLLDARVDLVGARNLARSIGVARPDLAVVAVMSEGGLAVVSADWDLADVVLADASPAELHARIRLARPRLPSPVAAPPIPTQQGDLAIDPSGYSARIKGRPLDLTYKEFELLRCLVESAGRVLTREQILDEVWGDDYYGGTRTVDVHVRRLRAKLGPENESLIGTVRNVGYRYTET